MTDTAIILAGGLGTRLRDVIGELPKPLAPVQGRPFIAWQLDLLAAQGIHTVVLATGYCAAQFRDALGESWGPMRLVHAPECEPLGTGGAIAHAAPHVNGHSVFVLNGDTYMRLNLDTFAQAMQLQCAWAGMALVHVDDATRFGSVLCSEDRVTGFAEKGRDGPGWINGGVYWFSPAALGNLAIGAAFSFERDTLPEWIRRRRLGAYRDTHDFIDIGTPDSYLAICSGNVKLSDS